MSGLLLSLLLYLLLSGFLLAFFLAALERRADLAYIGVILLLGAVGSVALWSEPQLPAFLSNLSLQL